MGNNQSNNKYQTLPNNYQTNHLSLLKDTNLNIIDAKSCKEYVNNALYKRMRKALTLPREFQTFTFQEFTTCLQKNNKFPMGMWVKYRNYTTLITLWQQNLNTLLFFVWDSQQVYRFCVFYDKKGIISFGEIEFEHLPWTKNFDSSWHLLVVELRKFLNQQMENVQFDDSDENID